MSLDPLLIYPNRLITNLLSIHKILDVMHQRPTYTQVAEKVENPTVLHIYIYIYTFKTKYIPDVNISMESMNETII